MAIIEDVADLVQTDTTDEEVRYPLRSREGQRLKVQVPQRTRSCPPRSAIEESEGAASRGGHSEVERRRRDRMNTSIAQLGKLTQNKTPESAKAGQTKCDILERACEYIEEVQDINKQLAEKASNNAALVAEIESLRHENESLKRQIAALLSQQTPKEK